jgi:DNA-binding NarL/FixJ family response regulator
LIRVCLVEDQTIVREGLRTLLALVPDIIVVAEAADGDRAIATILQVKPDVVLLDLRMPGKDGIAVLGDLRARGCQPPTIVLTTFDDDALVVAAVRCGAKGFLLKDVSLARLAQAIRTVATGGTMIQPALTERILSAGSESETAFPSLEPPDPLTQREIEVLRLLTGGYSNREIGDALGSSEGTVKNQISSILSKLGVRDRTRAVLKGLEMGLFGPAAK